MTTDIAPNSVAVIDWEHPEIDPTDLGLPSRVGKQFRLVPEYDYLLDTRVIVPFRLRDEDDLIHYRGRLRDDADCEVQSILADWGAADTGGFIIEVCRDGEHWEMEIG